MIRGDRDDEMGPHAGPEAGAPFGGFGFSVRSFIAGYYPVKRGELSWDNRGCWDSRDKMLSGRCGIGAWEGENGPQNNAKNRFWTVKFSITIEDVPCPPPKGDRMMLKAMI